MRILFPLTALAMPVDASFSLLPVNRGNTLNEILKQLKKSLGSENMHEKNDPLLPFFPEKYFNQTTDHFVSDNSRKHGSTGVEKWQQRFFENSQYYANGGPVFLIIGGEGPIDQSYVGPWFINHYLAKKYNGTTVALEHRFYGKSQPFRGNLNEEKNNLYLLNSRQALADLAKFQTDYIHQQYPHSVGKVICIGGSYPGNLAAWYKQLYPDLARFFYNPTLFFHFLVHFFKGFLIIIFFISSRNYTKIVLFSPRRNCIFGSRFCQS